jgi:hypothetical protein
MLADPAQTAIVHKRTQAPAKKIDRHLLCSIIMTCRAPEQERQVTEMEGGRIFGRRRMEEHRRDANGCMLMRRNALMETAARRSSLPRAIGRNPKGLGFALK